MQVLSANEFGGTTPASKRMPRSANANTPPRLMTMTAVATFNSKELMFRFIRQLKKFRSN